MSIFEIALRLAAALLFVLAGGLGAWWIVDRILGGPSRGALVTRLTLWGAAGSWAASVAFHAFYFAGLFHVIPATLFASAVITSILIHAPTRHRCVSEISYWKRFFGRIRWSGKTSWRFVVLSAIALLTARALYLPPLGWDTLTYHGVRWARWIQGAGFTYDEAPSVWNLFRHYFAGSEVLSAWAALPMHSDLFVGLAGISQWLFAGLGVWAVARELGAREPLAQSLGWAWLVVPTLWALVGSGYVELGLLAFALAGIAGTLRYLKTGVRGYAICAAGALGVSAGIKLPGLLPAAVCGIAIAFAALRHEPSIRRASMTAVLALVAMLAPLLPWLVFNTLETGAPLSPAPLRFGPLVLGIPDPAMAWFQERGLEGVQYQRKAELHALKTSLGELKLRSSAITVLGASWLILAPIGWIRVTRRSWSAGILSAAVILTTLGFYYLPGMTIARILWPLEGNRYLLVALTVASALSAAAIPMHWRALSRILHTLFAASAIYFSFRMFDFGMVEPEMPRLIVVATIALATFCIGREIWKIGVRRKHKAISAAVVFIGYLVGGSLIAHKRSEWRPSSLLESFHVWPSPRYWVSALPFIDEPNKTHVIAVTSGPHHNTDNWWTYALHGAHFQNRVEYIPMSESGEIVHFGPDLRRERAADGQAWKSRLLEEGVTEVFTFHPRSIEQYWMDAEPQHFEQLVGDQQWGLYRINRQALAQEVHSERDLVSRTTSAFSRERMIAPPRPVPKTKEDSEEKNVAKGGSRLNSTKSTKQTNRRRRREPAH